MKNKYSYFILKITLKMLIGVLIAAIIVLSALYLHSTVFAWDLAMFLKDIGIYTAFINNKTLLICLLFSMIVIISFFIIILKFSKYLQSINNAVEKIFLEDTNRIILPDELIEIEDQLNSINKKIREKTLEAKESEQGKNDLIVYLAHDLKTPLASVIGYLNLLAETPDISTETRAEYVNITLDRALRLENLINELFDITKFNLHDIELELFQLNVSMMLRQLIDEFYPLLNEKNLTLVDTIDSNLVVNGDSDKLARVFDNLLKNAIIYSEPNTTLTISATSSEDDKDIAISFNNQGNPIPSDKLNIIFEKFYRVDSSRSSQTGGSGLGLAVAKEIIKLHSGKIAATSDNISTTFTVNLPKIAQ